MTTIIVLSVIVWLSTPPMLSRAMVRRGYDGGSYAVVGVLFGPLAVVFAAMDVLCDVREPPRILERGRTGHGNLSVLVVVGGEPTTSPPAIALASHESRLRRLGLVQVVIPAHAAARGYDVVFTPRPDPILSARLKESGRIHWWGNDAQVFGSALPMAGWHPNGTEALVPASATPTDPARTA